MRATVCRTASSVAIYDAKDFSCGLFAPRQPGRRAIGGHRLARRAAALVGALGDGEVRPRPRARRRHPAQRSLYRRHAPQRRDGDLSGLPGRPADLLSGGARPLGRCRRHGAGQHVGQGHRIYQEGVRIPPHQDRGSRPLQSGGLDLLLSNMRVPEERLGDLQPSFAACRVAEKRIHEICARYGVDRCSRPCGSISTASEARMRACIAGLPDGAIATRTISRLYIGGNFEPLAAAARAHRLRRSHDRRLHRRLTTSAVSGQFDGSRDGRVGFIAVKSIFDPAAPLNQGSFRPIEVIAPPDHRQRAAARARRIPWRDPQARDRDDGRRAVAGRARPGGRRPLPDLVP